MSSQIRRRGVLAATGTAAAAVTASVAASGAAAAAPSGRPQEELFRFDNSALVFIDYQPEMYAGVRSMDTKLMTLNAKALARLAVKLKIPVVLSTVGVRAGINHPTVADLRQEIPNLAEIDRSSMNAWDDPAFRKALLDTGRRRFVMAGLWTEICLAFPVVDMQAEGLRTTFPADAVGGTSKYAHDLAVERMTQAGSVPNTAFAVMAEWALDWASPQAPALTEVATWYVGELAKLNQS